MNLNMERNRAKVETNLVKWSKSGLKWSKFTAIKERADVRAVSSIGAPLCNKIINFISKTPVSFGMKSFSVWVAHSGCAARPQVSGEITSTYPGHSRHRGLCVDINTSDLFNNIPGNHVVKGW